MKDLIEALTIFLKYQNHHCPTNCDHDLLTVCVEPHLVSDEDKQRLEELGFHESEYGFDSYRFGSC